MSSPVSAPSWRVRVAALRRWWARTWDNRVIAPRAYVACDPATNATVVYLPASEYDALPRMKPALTPWDAGTRIVSPGLFGTPVYRLPEWMDRRDYEAEWRAGTVPYRARPQGATSAASCVPGEPE